LKKNKEERRLKRPLRKLQNLKDLKKKSIRLSFQKVSQKTIFYHKNLWMSKDIMQRLIVLVLLVVSLV